MAQARTQAAVTGKEVFLSMTKPGGSTYVPIGCMSKFDETLSKELYDISCRGFTGKVASGKPAQSSITLDGVYFIYDSGTASAQVAYSELRSYINSPNPIPFKFGTPATGDINWARSYFIKDIKLTADNDGIATYSISLESAGDEVASTVS
ncbi:hypothetical protein [Spirosoma sp. KNUC1025]|uniref:hypothetical protein n=1 Tax=Spirosoma sp. KNUC1025 TaxID=2894082 RepID=UPI00386CE241|nr:hypothetical protein LN737_19210 [Spirosoma sp. KNUC1025]